MCLIVLFNISWCSCLPFVFAVLCPNVGWLALTSAVI